MDRIGLKEGEVIQHSMILSLSNGAQKKVEENNFGIRKRLLEYDDVMNKQRETIYRKRRNALFGDRLSIDLSQMFYDVCINVVESNWNAKDYEGFTADVLTTFGTEVPFESNYFSKKDLIS
jgi:preprotein translocase subunit SecA